jgi:hypothetical protein
MQTPKLGDQQTVELVDALSSTHPDDLYAMALVALHMWIRKERHPKVLAHPMRRKVEQFVGEMERLADAEF